MTKHILLALLVIAWFALAGWVLYTLVTLKVPEKRLSSCDYGVCYAPIP